MKPLTIAELAELAALPAEERREKACIEYDKEYTTGSHAIRMRSFFAGWDMATETMAWLHMQQKARELQEQANEPR